MKEVATYISQRSRVSYPASASVPLCAACHLLCDFPSGQPLSYSRVVLVGIYTLGAMMWYFTCGLKKRWKARRHGERLLWKNNQNMQNGLAWLLILLFLFSMALSWHGSLYPVPGELLYSIVGIIFTYLLLVPLLFSSIFLVRMHYILERTKSTPGHLQSFSIEDTNLVAESGREDEEGQDTDRKD